MIGYQFKKKKKVSKKIWPWVIPWDFQIESQLETVPDFKANFWYPLNIGHDTTCIQEEKVKLFTKDLSHTIHEHRMLHNPNGRKFGLKRFYPSHKMVEGHDLHVTFDLLYSKIDK